MVNERSIIVRCKYAFFQKISHGFDLALYVWISWFFASDAYQVAFFDVKSKFVQNLVPLNPNVFYPYDVLARGE